MQNTFLRITRLIHPSRLSALARYLLEDEAISGKLILVAVALALVAVNTPIAPWYESILHSQIGFAIGSWHLSLDVQHWISEGLMAFFFLIVGLELKRELVRGELRHKETAVLPFVAAIGGMIMPALVYLALNAGGDTAAGWAIPTATDIALAVGILALLGDRVPSSIRIFILALAIVDDILAVIVIGVFYSTGIDLLAIALLAALACATYALGKLRMLPLWLFAASGIGLWLLAHEGGIHPSIVGALLGLIAPIASHRRPDDQIAERVERGIIPFSTLIVVPLFAFTNAGISLDFSKLDDSTFGTLGLGIITGLVVGKIVGVFGASWLMVKLGHARLPDEAGWRHILGVGALAGIGFTVAIFVTDLAFTNQSYVDTSKLSVFIASGIAGLLGLLILRRAKTVDS